MGAAIDKMIGTVVRVFPNKGYGFLRGSDGLSRFFGAKECVPIILFDRLYEGQSVRFVPCEGGSKGNGLRAEQVELME